MATGRIIAIILILIGVAVIGRDTLASLEAGTIELLPLGTLWFELSAGSLNGLQAGIERYLWVGLWDYGVEPILHWPAFVFPLVPGLLLLYFTLRRGNGGRRLFKRRSR